MTTITNNASVNNDTTISSGTSPLSVSGDQGGDAIGQLNDLMVQMGQLFGKLRDLLRQYNQAQQNNAFKMQMTSYDTRMGAIEKDFDAKNTQAAWQIVGGVAQTLGGALTPKVGEFCGTIGHGADGIFQGIGGLSANSDSRAAQEGQALADYQHGLADQLMKRSDETLEKAMKVSSDLRDILTTLTQAHEKLASSVRMS